MTRISEQKVANQMQSVAPDTKYSLQEIIRQHRSELPGTSLQDMLANAVSGDPRMGVQERIFENLKTSLSLTDPYTKYSIQEMLELASANALTLDDVLGVSASSYYASITVDATQVSDADTADFSNFPLLFSGTFDGTGGEPDFRTVANGGKIQETTTGGNSGSITIPADLAFYDDASKTTQYDHEIESYNATTGEIVAWVKIPTLDYNNDTVFYVHYGDGTATNQENITGVWSANYQGVWHLNNSPDGTIYDSTSNANNLASSGSMVAGDLVTGQIGQGLQFETSKSQYISITDASQTGLDNTANFTVSAWAANNQPTGDSGEYVLGKWFDGSVRGYILSWDEATNEMYFLISDNNTTDRYAKALTSEPTDTNFHYLVGTYNATNVRFYIDGTETAGSPTASTGNVPNNTSIFAIGALGAGASGTGYFNGKVDEVRLSNTAVKTVGWIATEYNNQSSPATFYTVGSETGA